VEAADIPRMMELAMAALASSSSATIEAQRNTIKKGRDENYGRKYF
jgi:hypothetical protein